MSDLKMLQPQKVQNIINRFCYTIGMLPTSYKLSLTYEEQLLTIGKYLEDTVIPALNNNAEAVLELQNLFVDLQNYVNNYFDNLDVQNEINKKLDVMVQDGTFDNIINQNLFNDLDNKIEVNSSDIETLTNKVNKNTDDINIINSSLKADNVYVGRTIILGDSYSLDRRPEINITGWAIPLKNLLKLNDDDCIILQNNGGGFTKTGSLGTFIDAMNLNIPNKDSIKNIIVCGGLNDYNSDNTVLKNAIQNFITYCNSNYPCAKISLGMIGWNINSDSQDNQFIRYQLINNVLPAYQQASQFGAVYLNGVENVMHDYSQYYDPAHPNQEMCNRLAFYIYQAFKTGCASITYPDHYFQFISDNITTPYFSLTEKIVNNQTLIFDNNEYGSQIGFNSNYPVVNSYNFVIGDVKLNYISATYTNQQLVTCPAIFKDINDNIFQVTATIYLKNFIQLCCHFTGNVSDGTQIKEINLLNPYCSKPTIMQ